MENFITNVKVCKNLVNTDGSKEKKKKDDKVLIIDEVNSNIVVMTKKQLNTILRESKENQIHNFTYKGKTISHVETFDDYGNFLTKVPLIQVHELYLNEQENVN